MEFLKNKWAYLLLATALALMVGASAYLYVICRNREPYVGGMLVRLEQALPAGFTYKTVSRTSVGRLIKNLTPERVYRSLGEPSWYEGSRGSYTDVYILDDGAQAYLNFGTAHNRLTSLSIKETDGTSTVVRLN